MFKKILTSALIAGAAAGLIAGLLQFFFVQPILLHAEMFETGQLIHNGSSAAQFDMPPYEMQRNLLSLAFAMLTFAGFALVLVALMNVAESRGATINGRTGLLWGIAGFVVFHLAPGFSLPPEVPGSSAADIGDRQVWWYGTVLATALAIWLIAFVQNKLAWIASIALFLAPHVIGAPQPEFFAGTAPTEMGGYFASRSLGVSMAAWSVLGVLAGYLWSSSDGA